MGMGTSYCCCSESSTKNVCCLKSEPLNLIQPIQSIKIRSKQECHKIFHQGFHMKMTTSSPITVWTGEKTASKAPILGLVVPQKSVSIQDKQSPL